LSPRKASVPEAVAYACSCTDQIYTCEGKIAIGHSSTAVDKSKPETR